MAPEPERGEPRSPAPRKTAGGGPFALYKPNRGEYVRWSTAAGAGVIALCFAWFLNANLAVFGETVQLVAPVVALVAVLALIFRLVGQSPKVVDFLIDTESELKKVNWSTRREVFGATRVVIFLVLLLGFILFIVDVLFIFFFEEIGVLKVGMLKSLFGSPPTGE